MGGGGDESPSIAPPKSVMSASPVASAPDVSVDGEKVGLDESTAMFVTDGGVVDLLANSNERLQLDKERSAREIKAERRALEDRRDAKAPKPGMGPTLNKSGGDDEGGFFSSMASMIGPWMGKIAMGLGGVSTAVIALKTLSNKWFKR
jgi:hypothetical protein